MGSKSHEDNTSEERRKQKSSNSTVICSLQGSLHKLYFKGKQRRDSVTKGQCLSSLLHPSRLQVNCNMLSQKGRSFILLLKNKTVSLNERCS